MNKKKIMIIDDEVDFLKITRMNLESTGRYEVMTSADAKDVIPRLNKFKPDLILLDMIMSGVDGVDVCEILNNDDLGRTIPIIIISALEKKNDRLKAFKAGVVDYLIKPVGADRIIEAIEKALKFK